jgi:hypothetical protein
VPLPTPAWRRLLLPLLVMLALLSVWLQADVEAAAPTATPALARRPSQAVAANSHTRAAAAPLFLFLA